MTHKLFEPAQLSTIRLRNRIIRSATHEGMADAEGRPTEELKRTYRRLAKGGVGAIITGYAGVMQNGKSCHHNMLMIDRDELVDDHADLARAAHQHGAAIILQVAHCGRQTRSDVTGAPTVAPSAIRDRFYREEIPRELAEADIDKIIDSFVAAVERAKQAGFDAVQLHLAHGYLLAEFLSPHMNRRSDRWGGSTANRYRIVGEIFRRAKARVGDYPVLVKLNAYDGRKNGMRVEEAIVIAGLLERSGCAAIEVSCGVFEDGLHTVRSDKAPVDAAFALMPKYRDLPNWTKGIAKRWASWTIGMATPTRNYNVAAAQRIKEAVSIPVIVVGGIRSVADMTDILDNGRADFVAMSRPFIMEPTLVARLERRSQESARCHSCSYCAVAQEVGPLRCHDGRLPNS